MKISREARRTARELFRLSMVNGRLEAGRIQEISSELISKKPRDYVATLKEFTRLVRLELSKRHAVVESASALDASTSAEIEQNLKQKFGTDITVEFNVNPALLGGMRVKLGSDVWDGSISARLATLQKHL